MVRRFCIPVLAFCLTASAEDITPHVGLIEIYGAHKVSAKKIKSALGFEEGDALPVSRDELEDRVAKVPGVVASRVEATCCDQRKMILYVGVEERDTPHFVFRTPPTAEAVLPEQLVDVYHAFLDAVSVSLRGHVDEDLTNGYSLMADPECRDRQQMFLEFAERDLATLDNVLRNSSDSEQREIAAYVLQYGPRGPHTTKTIVDALQYALLDSDDTVRRNAMQSLKAVAIGAKLHPEQRIRLSPTWFVELMNSVVWSDRRDASLALVNLTDKPNPAALTLLRERALESVVEMARWHDLEHALPGFILAGRLAGLDDKQIQEAWVSGDREPVLEKALYPNGKKSILGAATSVLHKSKQN